MPTNNPLRALAELQRQMKASANEYATTPNSNPLHWRLGEAALNDQEAFRLAAHNTDFAALAERLERLESILESVASAFDADNQPCCANADKVWLGLHETGCPKMTVYAQVVTALEEQEAAMSEVEHLLFSTIEGEAIKLLLSGNDTQCFTTEQYADAMDKSLENMLGVSRESLDVPAPDLEVRRRQLRACGLVSEVRFDVWRLK